MTKRKSFSAEFKREVVRLLESSKKQPSDLARKLRVRRKQRYKCKEQIADEGNKPYPEVADYQQAAAALQVSGARTPTATKPPDTIFAVVITAEPPDRGATI